MIKTPQYIKEKESFRQWLDTLGYAKQTVKSLPLYIAEFLQWLEDNNVTAIGSITPESIKAYLFYFKRRKNKTTGAGLSHSHINQCILALNKFTQYLHDTGRHNITVHLEREENKVQPRLVYTQEQLAALYQTTYHNSRRCNNTAFGQRDRAMIAVYYGCGLRKSEGERLTVNDIDLKNALLHVTNGKGGKERKVPIAGRHLDDIKEYLAYGRRWFMQPRQKQATHNATHAFFISKRGHVMSGAAFYIRLKLLSRQAGLPVPGLHTLRHSIATHLLQQGMSLENIARFMGHSTLESTQLYTHLLHEL